MIVGDLIKSAVAVKLHVSYPELKIYKEKIEQGLKFPHFFILQINTSKIKELRESGWIYYQINVRYRPQQDFNSKYSELEQIGVDLFDTLEYIDVSGWPLRGADMNYQIVDGVLQFFVNYRMRIKKEQELVKMLKLQNSAKIKEDE